MSVQGNLCDQLSVRINVMCTSNWGQIFLSVAELSSDSQNQFPSASCDFWVNITNEMNLVKIITAKRSAVM